MVGTVASPTPTVPIWSDSTSVISSRLPSRLTLRGAECANSANRAAQLAPLSAAHRRRLRLHNENVLGASCSAVQFTPAIRRAAVSNSAPVLQSMIASPTAANCSGSEMPASSADRRSPALAPNRRDA